MANPPFNVDRIDKAKLVDDKRFPALRRPIMATTSGSNSSPPRSTTPAAPDRSTRDDGRPMARCRSQGYRARPTTWPEARAAEADAADEPGASMVLARVARHDVVAQTVAQMQRSLSASLTSRPTGRSSNGTRLSFELLGFGVLLRRRGWIRATRGSRTAAFDR